MRTECSSAELASAEDIVRRLWGHITDLRFLLSGQSRKTLAVIESEMELTEEECTDYFGMEVL